ncbi:MAG: glycosyltransferase [Cyanobium sp.]
MKSIACSQRVSKGSMMITTYLRKAGRKARQLSKAWIYPVAPSLHSFIFFKLRQKLVSAQALLSQNRLSDLPNLLGMASARPYTPLVSIIVPCYNHKPYLRQRLDCIYQQTYANYEVILLDDCSTDGSGLILEDYARKHIGKTSLIRNSINSGSPFRQWKKGLHQAHGELIWIAESDDFCDLNFLAQLVPAFQNEAIMLAFSQIRFIDEGGKQDVWSMEQYLPEFGPSAWKSSFTTSTHKLVLKSWSKKNIIPNVSAAVFRRHTHMALLDNEDWLQMRVCGDWLFYLWIARSGLVFYTHLTSNYYRQHKSNSSVSLHKELQYLEEHIKVAEYIISTYQLDAPQLQIMGNDLSQRWFANHSEPIPIEPAQKIHALAKRASLPLSLDRKPNILIVTYSLIPGGGEIFPLKLANVLYQRNHAVAVLNCHQHPNKPGVRAMLQPGIPLLELQSLENLPKLVRELGIEIIHSHHPWVDTTIAELLDGNSDVAHVITSHGMYDEIDRDDFQRIGNLLQNWAKEVSYVADKNRQPLIDLGFGEVRLRKIPNAIDPIEIEAQDRSCFGIAADAFVVCLVSRARREKGWQEAIEAVAIAQSLTSRPIHLLLAGEGAELQRLKPITDNQRIHFLGFQSHPCNLYACADLGILPTFYPGESQPLSLIECLAAGKPFLSSDLGEIASMLTIPSGIAGAALPLINGKVDPHSFAKHIVNYAENRPLHQRHCELAKRASRKFDPEIMANGYERMYKDALIAS